MKVSVSPVPRTWLVTGASRGLGRALVSALLARGERVAATARTYESLGQLAEAFPDTCRLFELDVTDSDQVAKVVSDAAVAFGEIDVVVNNAGYGLIGAFEELGEDEIARNFQTNFFGALDVIRAVLPLMRAAGSGHIVNISAAAAISNYPGFSIYGATKWALEGVSESLAAELKPLGIKVTLVQPGPFRTDFVGHSLQRSECRIADYEGTSGKFLRLIKSMDGRQTGDPEKAAQAIITAVSSADPPLRLVLGKYANEKATKTRANAEEERAVWEVVGLPTEFTPTR